MEHKTNWERIYHEECLSIPELVDHVQKDIVSPKKLDTVALEAAKKAFAQYMDDNGRVMHSVTFADLVTVAIKAYLEHLPNDIYERRQRKRTDEDLIIRPEDEKALK